MLKIYKSLKKKNQVIYTISKSVHKFFNIKISFKFQINILDQSFFFLQDSRAILSINIY